MKMSRLATVAAALSMATAAQGQTVHFVGSNVGCFYTTVVCTPSGSTTTAVFDSHAVTYTGSTFDAYTADGFLAIGNNAGTPNVDNLGSISVANTNFSYSANPTSFVLQTTFTSPASTQATFTALLHGAVHSNGSGGVSLVFSNPTQTFNYPGGSFTYSVNNLSVTNGKIAPLTGDIVATTVPEPSSVALLGIGLVGLVPVFRRKKI